MTILSFILVYVTTALFIFVPDEFHEFQFRQYSEGAISLAISLIAELLVASVANAIWFHQSFWIDVLLPIFLPTLVFLLYMWLISSNGSMRRLRVFVQRIGTHHIAQALFLAAICFSLVAYDTRAITTSIAFDRWLPQTNGASVVFVLNSYIMVISFLWMVISFSRFNLKWYLAERKARKQHPLIRREGYDIRRCGRCADVDNEIMVGHCTICHGTGRVEVKAPSIRCSRCSGAGWIKERRWLTGSASDLGVDKCPDCLGKGWSTNEK